LIFVQGDKHGSSFSFSDRKPFFPATFVEEVVFSPLYVFDIVVNNKVGIALCIHIRALYSVSLVFMSVITPVL
jgi:hypothetical protein